MIDFLRTQDEHDKAAQVDRELPAIVDTETDTELLDRFGLNAPDMVAELAGGGGLGNISGS
jgi:hypothetical protein